MGGSDTHYIKKRSTSGVSGLVSLDGSKSKNNISHKSLSNEAANLNNLSNLPFYNCSQPDLVNELIETNLNSDYIECIKNLNDQDFTLIHLNINKPSIKILP